MRLPLLILGMALASACDSSRDTKAPPKVEAPPAAESVAPATPASAPAASGVGAATPAPGATGERRGYGPAEMKLRPCVSLVDGGVLAGRDCPPGFVVFGPYVAVPGDANVDFVFEIETTADLTVYSELVSEAGKVFYGGLPDQPVARGTRRRFAQRIHLFDGVEGFEARIVVRAEKPASFKLRDLVLTVN